MNGDNKLKTFTVGKDTFDIPANEAERFVAAYPNAVDISEPESPISQAKIEKNQTNKDRVDALLNQPFEDIYKGYRNLQQGNRFSGSGEIVRGGISEISSPFTLAMEGWNSVPIIGPGVATLIGAVPQFADAIARTGMSLLDFGLTTAGMPESKRVELVSKWLKIPPEEAEKGLRIWTENFINLGTFALLPAMTKGIGMTMEAVPDIASRVAVTHATKLGGLRGVSGGTAEMRRGGKAAAEFDISRPSKTTIIEKGKYGKPEIVSKAAIETGDIVADLSNQFQEKIIDPATLAGELINGQTVLDAYQGMKDKYLNMLTPKAATIRLIDKMIDATRESLRRSGNPGFLTPDEAQNLKMINNEHLEQFYNSREKAGGKLSPAEKIEQQVLSAGNTALRQEIEALNPQIPTINWTEAALLDLQDAAKRFILQRYRQQPATFSRGAVSIGSTFKPHIFTIADFLSFKPFRDAYHKFMVQQASKFTGQSSEFIRDIQPYQAPPASTAVARTNVPPAGPQGPQGPQGTTVQPPSPSGNLPPASSGPGPVGSARVYGEGESMLPEGQKVLPQNSAGEIAKYEADKNNLTTNSNIQALGLDFQDHTYGGRRGIRQELISAAGEKTPVYKDLQNRKLPQFESSGVTLWQHQHVIDALRFITHRYPNMVKLVDKIYLYPMGDNGAVAFYDWQNNVIAVNSSVLADDPGMVAGNLIHELTHAYERNKNYKRYLENINQSIDYAKNAHEYEEVVSQETDQPQLRPFVSYGKQPAEAGPVTASQTLAKRIEAELSGVKKAPSGKPSPLINKMQSVLNPSEFSDYTKSLSPEELKKKKKR